MYMARSAVTSEVSDFFAAPGMSGMPPNVPGDVHTDPCAYLLILNHVIVALRLSSIIDGGSEPSGHPRNNH